MSIDYGLICDDCGKMIDSSGESIRYVRARAIKEGTAIRLKGKDFCKKCLEDVASRKNK